MIRAHYVQCHHCYAQKKPDYIRRTLNEMREIDAWLDSLSDTRHYCVDVIHWLAGIYCEYPPCCIAFFVEHANRLKLTAMTVALARGDFSTFTDDRITAEADYEHIPTIKAEYEAIQQLYR